MLAKQINTFSKHFNTLLIRVCVTLLLLFCAFFNALASAESLQAITLRVAVASNFVNTAKALTTEFEQNHQVKLQWISGATGTLFQQISHGAPFDVFFAADKLHPIKLAQQGLLVSNSVNPYTIGQLSIAAPNMASLSLQELPQLLTKAKRIAIANPRTAPYGKVAKLWLQNNQLWNEVVGKTIVGSNVAQTFQQTRSKAVDFGFVATSQVLQLPFASNILTLAAPEMLSQYAGVVSRSENQLLATALIDYFRSPQIQSRLSTMGYLPIPEQDSTDLTQTISKN
ncbi:molybdate ABC transporter substrate-binding protein [Colwellia sp. MEBiC06753]